jgi:hypothetical protein
MKTLIVVPALAGCLVFSSLVYAQSKQPSTDEDLLKRLDANPVDDYDRELFGGQGQPGKPAAGDGGLKDQLQRELGAAAVKETDDPLADVAKEMRQVQELIGKQDIGPATQGRQQQIAAKLEELIEKARKSSGQCQPGAKPQGVAGRTPIGQANLNPSKPGAGGNEQGNRGKPTGADKDPRKGTPGKVDLAEVRKNMKDLWEIHLQPRDREQMLQQADEEFLPKYELLIEEYFRRLSEEKK